jgi:hypothetical protein
VVSKSRLNAVRLGFCRPAVGFGIEIVMIEKAKDVATLRKLPGRMTLAVISPKKHSTKLSQEEEVGMNGGERGMTLEPGGDFGVLVGRVVVANDVKLEFGSYLFIDLAQGGQPLLMSMARGGMSKYLAGKVCSVVDPRICAAFSSTDLPMKPEIVGVRLF